jgi:hypothetical protein
MTRRSLVTGLACCLAPSLTRGAQADDLPLPAGKPLLTVSGKIGVANDGEFARFDCAMLEALGTSHFTTSTPWYDGLVTFEGVPMAHLMKAVQARGETIIATALNDYETKIPVSDFAQFPVLLALKRDGEYMPVRDKGPLFIVYHYDSDVGLKTQKYYGRSAWQLNRIVVV